MPPTMSNCSRSASWTDSLATCASASTPLTPSQRSPARSRRCCCPDRLRGDLGTGTRNHSYAREGFCHGLLVLLSVPGFDFSVPQHTSGRHFPLGFAQDRLFRTFVLCEKAGFPRTILRDRRVRLSSGFLGLSTFLLEGASMVSYHPCCLVSRTI